MTLHDMVQISALYIFSYTCNNVNIDIPALVKLIRAWDTNGVDRFPCLTSALLRGTMGSPM